MIPIITKDLLVAITNEFSLNLLGLHGVYHWARVLENGRMLTKNTEANHKVVELFAVLHDSKRQNDGFDPNHGKRAAEFVRGLNGRFFNLENHELELLTFACERHNRFDFSEDVTVQICWDSDRLDLLRAGIMPNQKHLFTTEAKNIETIKWANQRSLSGFVPDLVKTEWGF